MKRLFRILAGLTLLLFLTLLLASTALWIRSYCIGEQISWRTDTNSWFVTSAHGSFMVLVAPGDMMSRRGSRWAHQTMPPFPSLPTNGLIMKPLFLGIQTGTGDQWQAAPFSVFAMPWWHITLCSFLMTLLPARFQLTTRRRRKRLQKGLCAKCGYDLRATPTQCPECGAVASPKS
jgi:hypothetical protein